MAALICSGGLPLIVDGWSALACRAFADAAPSRRVTVGRIVGSVRACRQAVALGCPTRMVSAMAARAGRLDVVQWARWHRWGEATTSWAAIHGHADVLEWSWANGCDQMIEKATNQTGSIT
jgi:hypothetical protein